MIRRMYDRSLCVGEFVPNSITRLVMSEVVEENGVFVRKSLVKDYDINIDCGQFDYRDFNIQNLLQVGAYKERPIIMGRNSEFGVIDTVANLPLKPVENA